MISITCAMVTLEASLLTRLENRLHSLPGLAPGQPSRLLCIEQAFTSCYELHSMLDVGIRYVDVLGIVTVLRLSQQNAT